MRRNQSNVALFYRSFELDRATVDKENRTVDVSFSSETPVKRYFGDEILLHGSENVDLSHLKSMGSALMNHNPDIIVGPLKKIRIESRRGRATIKFDDDQDGNRALNKVESGSLKGVSVGYQILKFREVMRDEEYKGIKGPAMVATRWMPYEISLTPIPADATVGIGRSKMPSLDGIDIERSKSNPHEEEKTMDKDEIIKLIRDMMAEGTKEIVTETVKQVREAIAEDARPKILVTGEELQELTGRAAAISPEAKTRVLDLMNEGRDAAYITADLLKMATQDPDARDVGDTGDNIDNNNRDAGGPHAKVKSFKQVDDDDFFRALKSPALFSLQ